MKDFLDSTNTNTNLDILLKFPEKLATHQCRVDQTPSPEELPLDPIEIKTDMTDMLLMGPSDPPSTTSYHQEQQLSQTDSYSKTDQMTKSSTSKVSNSFITSVTSITSLDTGYQGDGELSRPASRGGDHSPSNLGRVVQPMRPIAHDGAFQNHQHNNQNQIINHNNNNQNIPIVRRPDPMTDSDFFTESDAEDVMHRGDRRAQIIDGHLYGAMLQQGANVYISRQPSSQTEDSCMESSGIFTDVENRGDEDLLQQRPEHDSDMSPDGSTDTVKSTNTEYSKKAQTNKTIVKSSLLSNQSDSIPSAAHNSNEECGDRLSVAISDIQVIVADNISGSAAEAPAAQTTNEHNSNISNRPAAKTASTSISSPPTNIDKLHDSGSKLLATKKVSPIRKQNKNEANVALKKHELLSKRGGGHIGASGASNSNGGAGCDGSKLTKAAASSLLLSSEYSSGIENQENKRPVVVSALSSPSGGVGSASGSAGSPITVLRKQPQNKWDAVMNKIATNKTIVKTKNYSDVKSKVTCGIARRDSPGLLKSPPATDQQQLLPAKRTLLSSAKR